MADLQPEQPVADEQGPVVAGPVVADEPVPKLPRGRGMKFSGPQLFRIAMTLMTLVAVMVLARPCANAVSNFVMGYEGSGKKPLPKPGTVDVPQTQQYEQLRPGMTDEELKAAIERAKARNAASNAGTGSSTP